MNIWVKMGPSEPRLCDPDTVRGMIMGEAYSHNVEWSNYENAKETARVMLDMIINGDGEKVMTHNGVAFWLAKM